MAAGRERNKIMIALCISAVVIVGIGAAAFIGLSRAGSTNTTTSDGMACGEDHALVVDDRGDVYAFGHNALGELGDMTCDNKRIPVRIDVPGKVVQVAAGDELSVALCSNGDLYAWGDDTSYQLGDGMNISRMQPQKIMGDVKSIAAGSTHVLAIKDDGALYVWGSNENGALGISNDQCDQTNEDGIACQSTPYKLMDNVSCISAGMEYSMAVTTDGTLYAWGYDVEGQLGLENVDSTNADGQPYQSVPAKVMDGVSKVVCGARYQALALTDGGDLYAWGKATVGSVGTRDVDNTTDMIQTTPLKIMEDVKDMAAGSAHSIALKTDGTAYTWGVNNFGQIGIAKGEYQYSIGEEDIYCQATPKKIMDDVEAIAAGGFMTMVRKSDGTVQTFGCNLFGQLGIGSQDDSASTPRTVSFK